MAVNPTQRLQGSYLRADIIGYKRYYRMPMNGPAIAAREITEGHGFPFGRRRDIVPPFLNLRALGREFSEPKRVQHATARAKEPHETAASRDGILVFDRL